MALSNREIESLEDMRIVVQCKAQGSLGKSTARGYAQSLLQGAMVAFSAGDVEKALWLANRELAFDLRLFGPNHPITDSCVARIKALKGSPIQDASAASVSPKEPSFGYHCVTPEAPHNDAVRTNLRRLEKRNEGAGSALNRYAALGAVGT